VMRTLGLLGSRGAYPLNAFPCLFAAYTFFLESTVKDQINPKRQTPARAPPKGAHRDRNWTSLRLTHFSCSTRVLLPPTSAG
jgi:hypothetical protein